MTSISDYRYHSKENLVYSLKLVGLKGKPDRMPYYDAYISVEQMEPTALTPPQNYVLTSELAKIKNVYFNILKETNIDIFELDGWFEFIYSDGETIGILPPVVEEVILNGFSYYVIADGMHRCYVAYLMHKRINVALVRGVKKKFPYYAFPRRNSDWNSIEVREDLPETYIKKTYVTDKHKNLFRDFTPLFNNKSVGRGYFKKGE